LRLRAPQLARHLASGLAPAYLLAGEEPLLLDEALAVVRAAGREAGFDEREVHVVERSFRWADIGAGAGSLSLFASRRIVELRMPSPRPGTDGAAALRAMVEHPDPDQLLVVAINAKLDSATARSAWVKSFEKHGIVVEVGTVERDELPDWLRGRAARLQLELTPGAAELLADRVEGHLLAGDQELQKLAMTAAERTVDEAEILEAAANTARFDVFKLTDAIEEGDAGRALRVLAGLRAEGVQPTLICWALTREISLLARLQFAAAHGERIDNALARLGVWRRRQPILKRALQRFASRPMAGLLGRAAEVDATIKGVVRGDPWVALTGLVIAVFERPLGPALT
jgi:DNA polymerase III subunit delta